MVNNGIAVIEDALFPGLDIKGPIGPQHHGGVNKKNRETKRGFQPGAISKYLDKGAVSCIFLPIACISQRNY